MTPTPEKSIRRSGKPNDTDRIEWLARRWDSQGPGHRLMGHFIKNPTGSFRDAIDADACANTKGQP